MGKARQHRGDAESDSLQSYLRRIFSGEPLSPEELAELSGEFEAAAAVLRGRVSRFALVANDRLQLIGDALAGECDITDVVLPSAFDGGKPSPTLLARWREDIAAALARLSEVSSGSPERETRRGELAETVDRYGVQTFLADEYVSIIDGYLQMLNENFSLRKTSCADFAVIRPEHLELVTGKLLMDASELPAEVRALADACRKLERLRDRMVEANLRLVVSIAQRFRNRGVPFNDLIQEGNLGLIKALERFDFKLGVKFGTYAGWWIRHKIFRVIALQSRVIRLPMHMIRLIQDIRRAEQRFIRLHGREPENNELARDMELPEARISAVRKMAMQTISLQTQIGDEDDGSVLEELVADGAAVEPAGELARRILYDRIYEMLRTLPEREQQIIIMRFGLFGNKPTPLGDISEKLHLTRERVRQLEIKILATLRSPEKLKFIDGCVHPGGL